MDNQETLETLGKHDTRRQKTHNNKKKMGNTDPSKNREILRTGQPDRADDA